MNRKLRLKKESLSALCQDDLLAVAGGLINADGVVNSIVTNCPDGCSCICSIGAPCCNTYACATYRCVVTEACPTMRCVTDV